ELPKLASSIRSNEEEITKLENKIINAVTETGNRTFANFVSCCRRFYESYSGNELFNSALSKLEKNPEQYGPHREEYFFQECIKGEADAYAAKLRAEQAFDCEDYRPTGNRHDLTNLKHKIRDFYENKRKYGQAIMFKTIYEAAVERLKQAGVENYRRMRISYPRWHGERVFCTFLVCNGFHENLMK
uniref:Uncharacterized protein n=1 Tax=Trichobilharzia regenti TaxID=157069 RepID=A0AA85KEF9_TRIRE